MSAKPQTLPRVILFWGRRQNELVEELNKAAKTALQGGDASMNLLRVSGDDCNLSAVLEHLRTLPFLAPRRVAVIQHVERLAPAGRVALVELLAGVPEEATLLLSAGESAAKAAWFKKLCDAVQKLGSLKECDWPKGEKRGPRIRQLAEKNGLKLTAEALQLLVEWMGDAPDALEDLLGKVALGATQGQAGPAELLPWLQSTRELRTFDLLDAVFEGRMAVALRLSQELLEGGEALAPILTLLARHMRILSQIRAAKRRGMSQPEIQALAGVPGFVFSRYLSQAAHWSEAQLRQAYAGLRRADRRFKSMGVKDAVVLADLMVELLQTAVQASAQAKGPATGKNVGAR